MGRPKGSKNKPKARDEEKTSKRIVQEETTFIGQSVDGNQPVRLIQELERYSFSNIGQAMFFVTAPHSKVTKELSPGETRDDFSKKERARILDSQLYKAGQVVEVIPEEASDSDSPNSLNDKQLDSLLMLDNEEIKTHILTMDSIFALNRVKERIMEQGLPAHLTAYIDSRIIELQSKYEEDNRAPVDTSLTERSIG